MKAAVVGAGLAGLVCARTLYRAGWEVVVLEASEGMGGRVRTDVTDDGFQLDRGFQFLLTGDPAVRRHLDLKALKLRAFDAGVVVVDDGRWHELGDPFRDLKALLPSALSSLPSAEDKRLALQLRRKLRAGLVTDESAQEFLQGYGFSRRFVDRVLRGIGGLLFLDRALQVSASRWLRALEALIRGKAAVPRDGMQAVPDQLARELPDIRLNTAALRLQREPGLALVTSSETVEADVVVLAAHSPEVERLSGIPLPKEALSATCLYFHLPYPLYGHKKAVINASADGFVSHAAQITNVAPSYAPAPEHLLCATILGAPDESVETLTERAVRDMQAWFPWRQIGGLTALAAYQMPFARLLDHDPISPETDTPGLFLAGDYTTESSMGGALTSGERAAEAILRRFPD